MPMGDVGAAKQVERWPSPKQQTVANRQTRKIAAWACHRCRNKKVKCDGGRPSCSACAISREDCVFPEQVKRTRLSKSREHALRQRLDDFEDVLKQLKSSVDEDRVRCILNTVQIHDGHVMFAKDAEDVDNSRQTEGESLHNTADAQEFVVNGESLGINYHLHTDDHGSISIHGPTNTLYTTHSPDESETTAIADRRAPEHFISAQLTAQAAKERHIEYYNRANKPVDFDDLPRTLVFKLLDIQWARDHSVLLTYRPAFMRDMFNNGPYYSKLLLYALLYSSTRYSNDPSIWTDPDDPSTIGGLFLERAKSLALQEIDKPSIPTVTALLALGGSLVTTGGVTTGWIFTGIALRMMIDLGLHLDTGPFAENKMSDEDIEIRKRVFWGGYIHDRLQSLYLGRSISLPDHDIRLSRKLLDVYEEHALWEPRLDLCDHTVDPEKLSYTPQPTYSISSWTRHLKLCEISGRVLSQFYAVNSMAASTDRLLRYREDRQKELTNWIDELPDYLRFTPWEGPGTVTPPMHIITLHSMYNSLVILLNRAFVADGHLRKAGISVSTECWRQCTAAAFKVAHLVRAYGNAFTFIKAMYQLYYTAYVASTIHARNAMQKVGDAETLKSLQVCLNALTVGSKRNKEVNRLEKNVRELMEKMNVHLNMENEMPVDSHHVFQGIPTWDDLALGPTFDNQFDLDALFESFPLPYYDAVASTRNTAMDDFLSGSAHETV